MVPEEEAELVEVPVEVAGDHHATDVSVLLTDNFLSKTYDSPVHTYITVVLKLTIYPITHT